MSGLTGADWNRIRRDLDVQGWSLAPGVLPARQCQSLIRLYADEARFRSTVTMERVGFGRGEYRYLSYPLPAPVESLRQEAYAGLAPLANEWEEKLRRSTRYPPSFATFLDQCHGAEQRRPTPLLLRYRPGDFNRLHQDVYGPIAFPLQMLVVLSEAGTDYEGGEVILLEQRPRMQSRATAIVPKRGDALFFANRERPVAGRSGFYRVQMRHGASELRRGERYVLGVIFHDAA